MNPHELATLYLEQLRRGHEPWPEDEPNAVFILEELVCESPEEAWPVFEYLLPRALEDETLEQVWFRLRLLLHHHYDAFHERVGELFARFERLRVIAGDDALDRARYAPKPLNREKLIEAYLTLHRTHAPAHRVEQLTRTDPQRALAIAIEIIHRGMDRGWDSFDVMAPLADLLSHNGKQVIAELEAHAARSVAVRRVLWRLKPQMVPRSDDSDAPLYHGVDPEVWERARRATGATTDYTEPDAPSPPAQQLRDEDERMIEAWFTHEANFWAFDTLDDLCDEDPRLAWDITLELIQRAKDQSELAVIAAGPLEDLIREHTDVVWDDVVARARTDERFRTALHGVWVFEGDGEVYQRFAELMATLDGES